MSDINFTLTVNDSIGANFVVDPAPQANFTVEDNIDVNLFVEGSIIEVIGGLATPYIQFTAPVNGAGQSFQNANIARYQSNLYAVVLLNGVALDPAEYVISGNTLTITTYILADDNVDIAPNGAEAGGGGNSVPGGPNSSIQFNNGGVLSGDANITAFPLNGIVQVRSNGTISGQSGGQFRVVDYNQSNSADADFVAYTTRGNIGAPVAVQVGDDLIRINGGSYTGNGTNTIDGISGWTNSGVLASNVAALPTTTGFRPASNTYISSMGNANVAQSMTFDYTGNLTVPGNIITTRDIFAEQYRSNSNVGTAINFVALTYSNANIAPSNVAPDLASVVARGIGGTPLPLEVGDSGLVLGGFGYSGNGNLTINGQNNLTEMGSIQYFVDAVPTSNGNIYSTSVSIATGNTVSNTFNEMIFDSSGTLTVPTKVFTQTLQLSGPLPATSSSTGNVGEMVVGGGFIYVCTAANTWQRAALTTF